MLKCLLCNKEIDGNELETHFIKCIELKRKIMILFNISRFNIITTSYIISPGIF